MVRSKGLLLLGKCDGENSSCSHYAAKENNLYGCRRGARMNYLGCFTIGVRRPLKAVERRATSGNKQKVPLVEATS